MQINITPEEYNMTFDEFLEEYNLSFTDQQKAAIQAVDTPVCLLACPGSGKTRTLVARVGYLILCRNVKPENILTMTYTVSAAKDMSERFSSFFGPELARQVEFRTINALALRVLNIYAGSSGKKLFSLVGDEKERVGFIRQAYLNVRNGWPVENDIRSVGAEITYLKNMLYSEKEIKSFKSETKQFPEIYAEYQRLLKMHQKMDFDDQLTTCFRLLQLVPALLELLQNKYRYLCLDEAQDTSKVQYEIIRLLDRKNHRLFMVGDEDQSIYRFRGAFPEGLLNFRDWYPEGKILLMEKNFRSDAEIVNAADAFIRKNTKRHEKHMTAVRTAENPIRKLSVSSPGNQYPLILKELKEADRLTAILARNNESLIPLIDLLEKEKIPYNIRQMDMVFFTHPVVTDIRNFLMIAEGHSDPQRFLSVYYKSRLHLRKETAQKAVQISRKTGEDIFQTLLDIAENGYQKRNIHSFICSLNQIKKSSPADAIAGILYSLKYGEYLNHSCFAGQKTKVEILQTIAKRRENIPSFLSALDELSVKISEKDWTPGAGIVLSTIHSSKGLEYDSVYLIDAYKGYFPEKYPTGSEDPDILEEERRLYYVGITRAKKHLAILTYEDRPCPFTEELLPKKQNRRTKTNNTPLTEDEYRLLYATVIPGAKVEHRYFGIGSVVRVENTKAVIDFDSSGTRVLALPETLQRGLLKAAASADRMS